MAAAIATATLYEYPRGIDNTQRLQVLRGTFSIGFGTYPVGGFVINWAALKNGGGGQTETIPVAGVSSSILPVEADVQSVKNPPSGYIFIVDEAVGNLHVFVSANASSGASGPLIEGVGPNANIPADLANDVIQFTAYFVRE